MDRVDAIYNGRPSPLTPPPIAIYHEVFAKFTQEVEENPDVDNFNADELRIASNFLYASAEFFGNEDSRGAALQPFLSRALARPQVLTETPINLGSKIIKPDGVHRTPCIGLDRDGKVSGTCLITEKKNEVGTVGCDPMSQAECCIIAIYCSKEVCLSSWTMLRV